MGRRHAAPGQRLYRTPAVRCLEHDHGQPLGSSGAAPLLAEVRVRARGRQHRGQHERQRGQGELGRGQARHVRGCAGHGPCQQRLWRARARRRPDEQHHVHALGQGRQGPAERDAARHGQALADRAVRGGRGPEGTVQRRLHHQEDRHARGAGRQGPVRWRSVHARRCAARDAGGAGQDRYDLGGHHRSRPHGGDHSGWRPGP